MFIVAWLHNVMHRIPRPLLSSSSLASRHLGSLGRHLALKLGYYIEQNQCLISLDLLTTTEIQM